ncbi:peptide ABC transporter substrate-binding protein [Bacillus sp. HMF5848]|uniref:peptide ABC transporter substrate-binding protein n=1 Tax=Bacillus sp. HMF5848 TaxID=2495421 RepID=UPI000F77EBB4|nr:peptide ABC transporter substrate-binding protein [Bacillus sp. HMF5848]RSK26473.1 peptide ABC transporter substrate-binding protein [Bacillus sp. HMF5848]
MKNTKLYFALVLALVFSLTLAACGTADKEQTDNNAAGEGETTQPAAEQIFNFYESSDIPTMDTTQAEDGTSFNAMNQVFEGLYSFSNEGGVELGMAAEEPTIEEKEGEFVYTFKIRDNANWSDGSPVKAEDFVYAWQKALNPDTLSPYAFIFDIAAIKNAAEIQNADSELYGKVEELGAKAIDDKTLEVTVTKNIPYFADLMAFSTFLPQPKAFAEEKADKYALEADTMLYNGPFKMTEWNHGAGWVFKKNENYWNADVVTLETANFKVIKESSAALNLYKTGEIDRVGLSADDVEIHKEEPEFGVKLGTTSYFFRMNQQNPALANNDIRKALFYAYDRKALVDILINNGSIASRFWVPQDFVFGPDGKDFREVAPDGYLENNNVEKALEHWNKGLAALGTDTIELEFLTTDNDFAVKLAEYAQAQYQEKLPGIQITINKQPWKQFLEIQGAMDYDLATGGWGPDYPDPMTFMDLFITDSANNEMAYSNPKFDELILGAYEEQDAAKRWAMLQEAERILIEEDTAIIPTYQKGASFLMKEYVQGYTTHSFGPDYSLKFITIEK